MMTEAISIPRFRARSTRLGIHPTETYSDEMPSAEDYEDARIVQALINRGDTATVMVVDHFWYSHVDNLPGTDHWPALIIAVEPDTLPFDTADPNQGLTGTPDHDGQAPLTLTILNTRIIAVSRSRHWTLIAPNDTPIPTTWLASIFERNDGIDVLRVPVIIRFDTAHDRENMSAALNVYPWNYATPIDAR